MQDASARGADWAEIHSPTRGVSNNFTSDCIFLFVKGEGSKGA